MLSKNLCTYLLALLLTIITMTCFSTTYAQSQPRTININSSTVGVVGEIKVGDSQVIIGGIGIQKLVESQHVTGTLIIGGITVDDSKLDKVKALVAKYMGEAASLKFKIAAFMSRFIYGSDASTPKEQKIEVVLTTGIYSNANFADRSNINIGILSVEGSKSAGDNAVITTNLVVHSIDRGLGNKRINQRFEGDLEFDGINASIYSTVIGKARVGDRSEVSISGVEWD